MIRGFFYKFNRSFKNLKNVRFHVKLLSPTLTKITKAYNEHEVPLNQYLTIFLTLSTF